jgi:hypothetical protein
MLGRQLALENVMLTEYSYHETFALPYQALMSIENPNPLSPSTNQRRYYSLYSCTNWSATDIHHFIPVLYHWRDHHYGYGHGQRYDYEYPLTLL